MRPPERAATIQVEMRREDGSDRLTLTVDDLRTHATLRMEKFTGRLLLQLSDRSRDLIDIAATIYAADAVVSRGGPTDAGLGARWHRRFAFEIPVREPAFWSRDDIKQALSAIVATLSNDDADFTFIGAARTSARQPFLPLSGEDSFKAEEALLFSGGLDSLGGALEETLSRGNRVLLVSHHSSTKLQNAQTALLEDLRRHVGEGMFRHAPLSLQVRDGDTKETTHRTRSFLFAAVCAAVVDLWGLKRVRFYENGIVSMNLPISGQVVGTRATRSTHPKALDLMSALFSLVFGRSIRVDNPFFWKTKTDVVRLIRDLGAADLIRLSRSCGATREITVAHSHCGVCSQCIDRRVAMLAAGAGDDDPVTSYEVDPLFGGRPDGRDREMALGYIEAARRYAKIDARTFFATHGEAQRAVAHLGEAPAAAAERLLELHRRHGQQVSDVIGREVRQALDPDAEERPDPESPVMLTGLAQLSAGPAYRGSLVDACVPPSPTASKPGPWIVEIAGRDKVIIHNLGEIRGASAALVVALAETHLAAAGRGLAAEDFPTRRANLLAKDLGTGEPAVRRRLLRLRTAVHDLALSRGVDPPDDEAIVENLPGHGYRLNPDRVTIVRQQETSKASARSGSPRRRSSCR